MLLPLGIPEGKHHLYVASQPRDFLIPASQKSRSFRSARPKGNHDFSDWVIHVHHQMRMGQHSGCHPDASHPPLIPLALSTTP